MFYGICSTKGHRIYLITVLSFFVICQIIAVILFPGNYTMIENHISNLGSFLANPRGHWFFNIGAIITGILGIPNFFYLSRQFSLFPCGSKSRQFTRISIMFSIIGSIGLSFVGIFTEDLIVFHFAAAALAFGGFCIAEIIMLLSIICKSSIRNYIKKSWRLTLGFILLYGQLIAFWITSGIFISLDGSFGFFEKYPLWEWFLFFTLMIWLVGTPFLIKKNIEQIFKID